MEETPFGPFANDRQKEQEALARVKNNPVRMAMIRKSVEEDTKNKEKLHDKDDDKKSRKKHHHKKDKSSKRQEKRKASDSHNTSDSSEGVQDDRDDRIKRSSSKRSKHHVGHRNSDEHVPEKKHSERHEGRGEEKRDRSFSSTSSTNTMRKHGSVKRRNNAVKLTDEERAAKLREMQIDAELHEDKRWKRLKKAEENDAKEAVMANISRGKNFLDVVQKNVYGAGNEVLATIEESVCRRTHICRADQTPQKEMHFDVERCHVVLFSHKWSCIFHYISQVEWPFSPAPGLE